MNKKEDLEFIKSFANITITDACLKAKVDRGNLINGKTTAENTHLVRRILEDNIAKLFLIKKEEIENVK